MSILEVLFRSIPKEIRLTKPFITWFELEYIGEIPDNLLMRQCNDASKAVADVLINRYPNVSSISTTMLYPHEFFQKLIVELVVGYDKQLTKYANDMPTAFPYTLTAPKLVELDLIFYCDSSYQNLPTIRPRSLRKITIDLDQIPFSWDMFRVGNVSEAIVFNNLVDLSITDVHEDSNADSMAIENNLDLEFPKLERLHTKTCTLTRKTIQAMMSHGLKWLHCEGSFIDASQLCKQPLGSLHTLILDWVGELYPEETDDDFVSLSNEIFNKTDGIEHVQFEISSVNIAISMDGIDWPYLTHLSLSFMIPFKELFDMLPKVPNLVQLDMAVYDCDDDVFDETIELLTNIKNHYPIPSSSKIKTMCLTISHSIMRRGPCNKNSFGGVFENLKWYLPQLKNIDF
ncbi:hypothetical protein GGH12_002871 [Coemansia sp. RSA 1822]|nr:hypothetical protein LPJ76_001761 [Coemansia sp. RSA 638]KAJ2562996.1 hypothetical protein GGH12_002871 [Coemansia sp. RSA 1822]